MLGAEVHGYACGLIFFGSLRLPKLVTTTQTTRMKSFSTPEILPTHTAALFDTAVKRAAELLRAGELVALPTETVYGLAANAFDGSAVEKIFQAKGRPAQNPIIVHVASREMAKRCVASWPDLANKLAESFWPGPLTLVLPRSNKIPDGVTAGGETVGVRWPSHPLIQAVIRVCGFPLAAPSANPSNQISPTNAEHVRKSLGNRISLIIDGGQSQVGIESTVLDLTVQPPRLLRPGMIHAASLLAVTGELTLGLGASEEILRSPGLLRKHYSPKARLVILSWKDEADLAFQISNLKTRPRPQDAGVTQSGSHFTLDPSLLAKIHVIAHTHIPLREKMGRVSVIPHDAEAFARAIYAVLHQCDEAGAELIVVESLPNTEPWHAVRDRLQRAAAS
ncbi:MAG: L-threonylcarbamoyladenylate synthase [Verrucomicrobiota bacterium]